MRYLVDARQKAVPADPIPQRQRALACAANVEEMHVLWYILL